MPEVDEAPLDDQIVLTLPARDDYASIVRIAAASIALRRDVAISRIDDLRLAVDEAMILLLTSTPDASSFRAILHITDDALSIELAPDDKTPVMISEEASDRFVKICAGLIDDWEIDESAPKVRLHQAIPPAS